MTLARVRVLGLLAALLWVQWLGMSHAIWHSPWLGGVAAHGTWAEQPAAHPVASDAADELLAHGSDGQCRLFDQLAHSDALTPHTPHWAVAPPAQACLAAVPAVAPVRFALAYSARAPPAFLS